MNVRRLLEMALGTFEQGTRRHTTRVLARNAGGDKIKPTSPFAVAWDVIGAVMKAARTDKLVGFRVEMAVDLLHTAAREKGYVSATRLNDELGIAGALWMLRRALELLDENGPPTRAPELEGSTL